MNKNHLYICVVVVVNRIRKLISLDPSNIERCIYNMHMCVCARGVFFIIISILNLLKINVCNDKIENRNLLMGF